MNEIILAIQEKLAEVTGLKHIDKDWGQLSFDQPPIKWPCALIDFDNINFSQQGRKGQLAEATIYIKVATMRLTNSSSLAPNKEDSYEAMLLMEAINDVIHGWRPGDAQAMIRTNMKKLFSDKARDVYQTTYTTAFTTTPPVATSNIDTPPIEIHSAF